MAPTTRDGDDMTEHAPIATLTKPSTCPGVGGNAVIVATENARDKNGQYPGFVALVRKEFPTFPDRAWSTHVVFFNDEVDPPQWMSAWGHYDQTEAEARADFAERCQIWS